MKPKLILLNGFAGIGKSTLAKRYIADHSLAMSIEEDELIGMLGQWADHEDQARVYVLDFIKSIARLHLQNKQTVLIPHLLTNAAFAEDLESIANECDAKYFEIYLSVEKDEAFARLFERGTWGEAGAPPITKKDLPIMEEKYSLMTEATAKRSSMIAIKPEIGKIEQTHAALLKALEKDLIQ